MTKKKDKVDQVTALQEQLQRVRQDSLAASRRGDFRTVARLTCEAAKINRTILGAEGAQHSILHHLGDKFFVSSSDEAERQETLAELVAA